MLNWIVDEVTKTAEVDDLIDNGLDLLFWHPKNRPVQTDVFAPGHLWVEARPKFNK